MITKVSPWKFGHKVWYRQFDNQFVIFPATVLKFLGRNGTELVYEIGKVDRGLSVKRVATEKQLCDASTDPAFSFKVKGFYNESTKRFELRNGAVCATTFEFELRAAARRNEGSQPDGGEVVPPKAELSDKKGAPRVREIPIPVEWPEST